MSERTSQDAGGLRAPRSSLPRVLLRVVSVLALVAVAVGAAALVGSLPSDTDAGSLVLRAGVGLAVGGVMVVVVYRMLRAFGAPPPPPLERVDAREADVTYVCGVCGTRLRLEVAATGKPPRHCGEEMEPRVEP